MRMATLVGRVGIGEKEYPRARLSDNDDCCSDKSVFNSSKC